MSYNSRNQITWVQNSMPTGPTYGASGGVIQDAMNTYLYDSDGRVCAVKSQPVAGMYTMVGYVYNAEGERVSKGSISSWTCDIQSNGFQAISDYITGPTGEQMTETGADGSGNMVWAHTNVYAAGSLIATYDKDGLHFYLDDWLGNRRVQTDDEGVVEQTCTNLPYGDNLSCTGSLTSPTEHHPTGKERDSESGNDYFGARYYSSAMGRFMSPDWSAKAEPVPYAHLGDPQTMNLYSYVRNNPVSAVDPDGHDSPYEQEKLMEENSHSFDSAMATYVTGIAIFVTPHYDAAQQQSNQQGQQNQSDQPSFSITASKGNLELNNANGSTVADYSYTTGMNGDTNPADKGKGPIPPGKYTLDPKEISKAGFFRRFIDPRDWGDYRAPLHPEAGTDTHGRSGFFLHGGWLRPGSEGCIKVNDLNQNRLFQLLQHSSGPVEVTVQ